MSDLRTAAQQALEAFDPKNGHPEHMWPFHVKGLQAQACKALRAALAEPDVPEVCFGNMSDTLPPLPEPHGWIYDGIPNMLLFNRGPLPQATALVCSTAPVYSADQMRSYAAAALAAAVAEPVASVTECEACFTPDVCQLRGTCDHYAAERLRVAAPPQREPDVPETNFGNMAAAEPVAWGRVVESGGTLICASSSRHNGEPLPLGTLIYTHPPQREPYDQTALGLCIACGWKAVGPDGCLNCAPQREPLTDEQIDDLSREMVKGGKSVNWLCRAIERARSAAPASAPKDAG